MDLVALAVRLVAVVIWIGGIAFAALVLLPNIGRRLIVRNEAYLGKQYVSPTI